MPSVVARYEDFLLKNAPTIASLESTLRSFTWFLPGRFKDAELASEALSAMLNVISMYHDTILASLAKNSQNFKPLIPPSLHSRFTTAWSEKSSPYKWTARILQIIQYTELLIEMTLRRKTTSKTKWRSIILLEILKALLRFRLLRITKKPVLSPPIPERDLDPSSIPPQEDEEPSTPSSDSTPEHLKNNRSSQPLHEIFTRPNHPSKETVPEDYLLPKALTTSSVKPSISLVQSLSSPQDWLAEVIYILRPLVYATMLANDRRTNRPLITILVMEFISRNLRRHPTSSAALERSEYARRDKDMLWYLLRGNIWKTWTRPQVQGVATTLSRVPLIGLVGALVQDWIPLIDEYYYYTSP